MFKEQKKNEVLSITRLGIGWEKNPRSINLTAEPLPSNEECQLVKSNVSSEKLNNMIQVVRTKFTLEKYNLFFKNCCSAVIAGIDFLGETPSSFLLNINRGIGTKNYYRNIVLMHSQQEGEGYRKTRRKVE